MSDRGRDNLSLLAGNSKPGFFMAAIKSLAPVVIGLVIAYLLQAHVKPNIAPYPAKLLLDIGIAIILAVSLNIVNGFTGQFSMGHAGFLAIGGYVSGMVSYYGSIKMWASSAVNGGAMSTMKGDLSGLPIFAAGDGLFLMAILAGGLAAAVMGIAVGLPSLRLRGDYLAIVTLGFGEIVRVLVQQTGQLLRPEKIPWATLYPDKPAPEGVEKVVAFALDRVNEVTGATEKYYVAVADAPWWKLAPRVGGALGFTNIPSYNSLFWVYAFVTVMLITAFRIKRSTFGRALLSIREDEIASEAMGVNTTRYKVLAFVIAAFFAGIAGALTAHTLGVGLSAETAGFQKSFDIIIMVVLGGLGSISGAVIAAVVVTLLPEWLRGIAEYRLIVYALALILMMIFRPKGLFGVNEIWDRAAWSWLLGRKGGKKA